MLMIPLARVLPISKDSRPTSLNIQSRRNTSWKPKFWITSFMLRRIMCKQDKVKVTNLGNLPKFKFWNFAKTLHTTHFLKLLDKMCKYEMDLASILEDTIQTRFCLQTDRHMERQGETSITLFNFVEVKGDNNLGWIHLRKHKIYTEVAQVVEIIPCWKQGQVYPAN